MICVSYLRHVIAEILGRGKVPVALIAPVVAIPVFGRFVHLEVAVIGEPHLADETRLRGVG